jgi:hypothetical protein
MMSFQPLLDVGAFPGDCAAVACGLFLFGAGGADLPVAAIDAGNERGIALEAPQVSAYEAQSYGGVADGVYGGAVHRIHVSAVGAGGDGCAPKVPVGVAVLLDSNQKGILDVIGEKFPHPQESTRYRLAHGLRLLLRDLEWFTKAIVSQIEQEPNEKIMAE